MSDNSCANFELHLDEDRAYEPVEEYNDVGYPIGLSDNLRQAGFAKPTLLQQTIIKCMDNKLCLVGNVPDNLDAQVAYVSYAIFECIKAKQDGKYKPDEYKPFALFIVKDEEMLKSVYLLAEQLAKDLDTSTVMLKTGQFDDEGACELALQDCDLVFLTADGFNKFVKDELVLFENLKVLVVHGLDCEADKKRIVQYKDMFEYHDFPKVNERILVFFDDNYSTIAEDVLAEDNKAFIVFGAGDGSKNLRVITDQDDNTEPEEIFEIHATEAEKDAALVEFLKPLIEPFKTDPYTCPRTVIYVNSSKTGAHVETLIRRSNLECTFVDGQRKRKDCQFKLVRFMHDRYPPILIAYSLSRVLDIPQFVDVTNIVHFEVPEFCGTYQINSQLCIKGFKPKKIISYLGAADYPAYTELLVDYVREGKNVEKLQQLLGALKPLFEQIPVEYDRYEEEEMAINDY